MCPSPAGPLSTPAQMINLIQPRVAGLWLNPIMLWCFVAIETVQFFSVGFVFYLCDERSHASFLYTACNHLKHCIMQSLITSASLRMNMMEKSETCHGSIRDNWRIVSLYRRRNDTSRCVKSKDVWKYFRSCFCVLPAWCLSENATLKPVSSGRKTHCIILEHSNAFLSGSICGWSVPLVSLPFICRFQRRRGTNRPRHYLKHSGPSMLNRGAIMTREKRDALLLVPGNYRDMAAGM